MRKLRKYHAIGTHNGERLICNFWAYSMIGAEGHIKNQFGKDHDFIILGGWRSKT